MQRKEYKLPNGKTAVFEYDACEIGKITLECMDELMSMIADRPQGEWIDRGWKGDWQFETDGRGHCWKVFECSVCNGENTIKTRFCPHCGAHMKGADDE